MTNSRYTSVMENVRRMTEMTVDNVIAVWLELERALACKSKSRHGTMVADIHAHQLAAVNSNHPVTVAQNMLIILRAFKAEHSCSIEIRSENIAPFVPFDPYKEEIAPFEYESHVKIVEEPEVEAWVTFQRRHWTDFQPAARVAALNRLESTALRWARADRMADDCAAETNRLKNAVTAALAEHGRITEGLNREREAAEQALINAVDVEGTACEEFHEAARKLLDVTK